MSVNIVLNNEYGGFNTENWDKLLVEAAKDTNKHICRVIYPREFLRPDGKYTFELKTDEEVKQHFKEYGSWNANCGAMSLREIINITRIVNLNAEVKPELKNQTKEALETLAERTEEKYKGFFGSIRKVVASFTNLFASDSVRLFSSGRTDFFVKTNEKHGKLPFVIGNNADFARTVAKDLTTQ